MRSQDRPAAPAKSSHLPETNLRAMAPKGGLVQAIYQSFKTATVEGLVQRRNPSQVGM